MSHDLQGLAQKFFGINQPVTEDELRQLYRKACIKLHPDTSGYPSSKDFGEMKDAFKLLLSGFIVTELPTATIEGVSLSELGGGLGETVNSNPCNKCDKKGYTTTFSRERRYCYKCDRNGVSKVPCPPCAGTGRYMQRNTKQIVVCKNCRGKRFVTRKYGPNVLDILSHQNKYPCKFCKGTKQFFPKQTQSLVHQICKECNGTGEVKIYNPVIPKGKIASSKNRRVN